MIHDAWQMNLTKNVDCCLESLSSFIIGSDYQLVGYQLIGYQLIGFQLEIIINRGVIEVANCCLSFNKIKNHSQNHSIDIRGGPYL